MLWAHWSVVAPSVAIVASVVSSINLPLRSSSTIFLYDLPLRSSSAFAIFLISSVFFNPRLLNSSSRHDSSRHDSSRHDSSRHDSARHDSARHDSARHDSAQHEQPSVFSLQYSIFNLQSIVSVLERIIYFPIFLSSYRPTSTTSTPIGRSGYTLLTVSCMLPP